MGLTPQIFWSAKAELLSVDRSDLADLVAELVASHQSQRQDTWIVPPTPVSKSGGRLLVSALTDIPTSLPTSLLGSTECRLAHVLITENVSAFVIPDERQDVLVLEMAAGKKGQMHFLHSVLPQSTAFIKTRLAEDTNVCVSCHNGRDASVGVVLAALQMFFDDDGKCVADEARQSEAADKQSLATRLQWIISDRPEANPSRVTLKRVNEFLLTSPSLRR